MRNKKHNENGKAGSGALIELNINEIYTFDK